jgi:hypothetical protein
VFWYRKILCRIFIFAFTVVANDVLSFDFFIFFDSPFSFASTFLHREMAISENLWTWEILGDYATHFSSRQRKNIVWNKLWILWTFFIIFFCRRCVSMERTHTHTDIQTQALRSLKAFMRASTGWGKESEQKKNYTIEAKDE